jgi:ribosomal-protein-alanine N-acetyltransferase
MFSNFQVQNLEWLFPIHKLAADLSPAMKDHITIRAYQDEDKDQVLDLLRLNTPLFFAPEEEKGLVYYLDHEIEYYYVLEIDQLIVGCGGFNFSGDVSTGKISWDILHPDYQGQGLGTALLKYRIRQLKTFEALENILVRTSQIVYPFYEKNGFKLVDIKKDYWAKGFDLYHMVYAGNDSAN